MKILIFGGGQNFIEYYKFCADYWMETEICAILDNDKGKWGKSILGITIISPDHIREYKYDVILICSVYEEEIREQLVYKFQIVERKIETRRHFFDEVIFPWYEKKYRDKKILIVGEKYKFDILCQFYNKFFNVKGFVDIKEIELVFNYDFDYILLTNYLEKKEEEVIDKITAGGCCERERILTDGIFLIFRNHIEQYSNGEKYADKKFLVICSGGVGGGLGYICNIIIKNVSFARQNGYIPIVDLKNFKSQYLEEQEYGIVNAWEKFFAQPDQYTLEDIKEAKYISRVFTDIKWEPIYKEQLSSWFPEMKDSLVEKYKKYLRKMQGKRVLGVLFRVTDYSQQKPFGHYVQPDLDTMVDMVLKKMKEWGDFDSIFYVPRFYRHVNVLMMNLAIKYFIIRN